MQALEAVAAAWVAVGEFSLSLFPDEFVTFCRAAGLEVVDMRYLAWVLLMLALFCAVVLVVRACTTREQLQKRLFMRDDELNRLVAMREHPVWGFHSEIEVVDEELAEDAQLIEYLSKFNIDIQRGFLPTKDPLQRLPAVCYEPWEHCAASLPALLTSGCVRKVLKRLPVLDGSDLHTHEELRRAMLILSAFAHAYVFGSDEGPADELPACIAKPLVEVADRLDIPPVLLHCSLVIYNWRRIDPTGPLTADNLATLQQFLGGHDEAQFYLMTVEIEKKAGAGLPYIVKAQRLVHEASTGELRDMDGALKQLVTYINRMRHAIDGMHTVFKAMGSVVSPWVFYNRIRPFVSGWKNNPALPRGLLYKGVSSRRQFYFGGSAAQSGTFCCYDAALGVKHDSEFLAEMRGYMLPGHRNFIKTLEEGPSIRDFVLTHAPLLPELQTAFDAAVEELAALRTTHMAIVMRYIMMQAPKAKAGMADSAGGKGTGGTDLMDFLRPLRKDTRDAVVDEHSSKAAEAAEEEENSDADVDSSAG